MQGSEHRLGKKLQQVGFLVDHYFYVHRQKIRSAQNRLDVSIPKGIEGKRQQLDLFLETFRALSVKRINFERHKIDLASQKALLSDPGNILKKGYSITTVNGKLVKDLSLLKSDATIKTQFYKGTILSNVIEINQVDKDDN